MKLLLLQGPSTPFFRWLADDLRQAGHQVEAVLFCGGDELYWRLGGHPLKVPNWRRCPVGAEALADWYAKLLAEEQPDALLLFGDCRPIHRSAVEAARNAGVPLYVLEEGYLRPHWITLEAGGVNGYSAMPREAEAFLAYTKRHSKEPKSLGSTMRRRIVMDILYHLANGLLCWRYPAYRTHRPYPIWREYLHWARRLLRIPLRREAHRRIISDYLGQRHLRYFLYPLQLDSDYQLRVHSRFGSQAEAMAEIIASFATHAQAEDSLLIKGHPLDNGMVDFQALTQQLAARHGLIDRVHFIEGGHLPTLLRHCKGVVLINSTVGLSALQHHLPVKVLGKAIYDMPGLTHQGGLESFWQQPVRPDSTLLHGFREYLMAEALVYGSFFKRTECCLKGVTERIRH